MDSNSSTANVNIKDNNNDNVSSINKDRLREQYTRDRVNSKDISLHNELVDLTNSESDDEQLYPVFTKKADAGIGNQVKDVRVELGKVFGHNDFRSGQDEVVGEAMSGRDVFVLMPTGGGKSLCYQLPAWCSPGLSVVISPLLSLMEDQVRALKNIGINAVCLSSTTMPQQHIISELKNTPMHGGIKLLYITPEKLHHSELVKNIIKELCEKEMVSRFVVDEVHCLSDW